MGTDHVSYGGLRLPKRRSNEGLQDDAKYLEETAKQIRSVSSRLSGSARVLDFGCGQGRLLNGLVHDRIRIAEYVGIDVDAEAISWCVRNLDYDVFDISFVWYNQANRRYHATGTEYAKVPVPENRFDLAFSNSVFSHLDAADAAKFAAQLRPLLRPDGRLYLTAFTESGVDACTVNPPGYLGKATDNTPLHRVRFNRDFFCGLFLRAGWELLEYRQSAIARTGQSEIIFARGA